MGSGHPMRHTRVFLAAFILFSLSCFVTAEPNQQTLTAFAKWIQQQQVHSKYNLGTFSDAGLGGVARMDIKESDTMIMVPRDAMISNEKIKTESFLKDIELSGLVAVEPTMLWLLHERSNAQSPYKAYLDVLPASFPSHPLSWTDEELAETAGTGLDNATKNIRRILQKAYENTDANVAQKNPTLFPGWSWDAYLWAFQVVNSRTWAITDEQGNKETALVPLADMLNHKPGAGTGGLTWDKQYFVINATQDYAKGEQVFDNYGPKSNYDLLSSYGFVMEENAYDNMVLHFELKPSNLVHSIVEPLLRAVDPQYSSLKIRANRVPLELLRVFRLSTMDFGELERVAEALQGKAVSLKNELRAYRAAIKALTEMLQSFPTSVQQDKELLANSELSNNQRSAIVLRKTQKELLVQNIVILSKMWENILLSGELFGGVAI